MLIFQILHTIYYIPIVFMKSPAPLCKLRFLLLECKGKNHNVTLNRFTILRIETCLNHQRHKCTETFPTAHNYIEAKIYVTCE